MDSGFCSQGSGVNVQAIRSQQSQGEEEASSGHSGKLSASRRGGGRQLRLRLTAAHGGPGGWHGGVDGGEQGRGVVGGEERRGGEGTGGGEGGTGRAGRCVGRGHGDSGAGR